MEKFRTFVSKHKNTISIILLGIIIRLIFSFFFNHMFDYMNILALVKSVADTGSLADGFFVLKNNGIVVQLYGKLYYQIAAIWLHFLDLIGVVDIRYIFDTKGYSGSHGYMDGFLQWSPPLYQLISIKMIQFLYDFILLYYMYKLAQLFNIKKISHIVLFWALNPFTIFVGFSMFQSDLAMLAFLTGGVYYWIKGKENNTYKDHILTFLFFSIGAVIKQVPLLLIPISIISFSKNAKSFVINTSVGLTSYILISQPWSTDAVLIKEFFLTSTESMALFNFSLNGVSIFIIFYLVLLAFITTRQSNFWKKYNILLITTLTLTIVYVSEDSGMLFAQFNIWILPFIGLLALLYKEFRWAVLVPAFGFLKRGFVDSDIFSRSLSPTLGSQLSQMLSFRDVFKTIFTPELVGLFLTSALTLGYIIIGMQIISLLINKKIFNSSFLNHRFLNLKHITLILFTFYFAFTFIHLIYKSKYVILPQTSFQITDQEVLITKEPLRVNISNPGNRTISGIALEAKKTHLSYIDYTIFEFRGKNGKVLTRAKINDATFPSLGEEFNVFLPSFTNEKNIQLLIYKEKGLNSVVLNKSSILEKQKNLSSGHHAGYDTPPDNKDIELDFQNEVFQIQFRGVHTFNTMIEALKFHINSKPSFYTIYFFIISIAIIILILFNSRINRL